MAIGLHPSGYRHLNDAVIRAGDFHAELPAAGQRKDGGLGLEGHAERNDLLRGNLGRVVASVGGKPFIRLKAEGGGE